LIEPARAVDHPRLAALCVGASLCNLVGRLEDAVRYSEVGQTVIAAASDKVSYFGGAWLGSAYRTVGQGQRDVEVCRAELARTGDGNTFAGTNLVLALATFDSIEEARAIADGLVETAEANRNPCALAWALLGCGYAFRDTDPARALEALRRGVLIAQDTGNRLWQTSLLFMLSGLEAEHGDRVAALDYVEVGIRNNHESGNIGLLQYPVAILAVVLDGLGRHEPAATIAGFAAVSPAAAAALPELGAAIAHLGEILGEATYESLARKGETMTTAALVNYAYDQIDQARIELNAVAN
jgi:hypothetical protein